MNKIGKIKLTKCSICSKKRLNELKELEWKSDLTIIKVGDSTPSKRFTICPECKEKYKLSEILIKLNGDND